MIDERQLTIASVEGAMPEDWQVCSDCGESFGAEVWHCRHCDHHYAIEESECGNCHAPNPDFKMVERYLGNLTRAERQHLEDCEITIDRGLSTFVEVGNALLRIRDNRLYRESDDTFECYLKRRWNMSRRRGYQLIEAAEAVENVKNFSHSPTTESHAKELSALKDPDQQREAWKEATAGAEPVTAKRVEEAVKKVGTAPLLEKLPEADRGVVARMTSQPGIPLPLAQKMVEKIAAAEPEQRRDVIALYQSEDVRDRNKAMTWAADRVTPADPRLVTYRECLRELKRTVREFPEDKEVPVINRAIALIEEAVRSIKGGTNGTVDD